MSYLIIKTEMGVDTTELPTTGALDNYSSIVDIADTLDEAKAIIEADVQCQEDLTRIHAIDMAISPDDWTPEQMKLAESIKLELEFTKLVASPEDDLMLFAVMLPNETMLNQFPNYFYKTHYYLLKK